MLITITRREDREEFVQYYTEHDVPVVYSTNAEGTARMKTLSRLGLEKTDKALHFGRCSRKVLHLAMTEDARGFSRVAAGFSSYDGEFRMPLLLAQESPIFHSSCEGKLGIALE